MLNLKIYEVGKDPFPEEGMQIILFDNHSSWGGMFSGICSKEGSVSYEYPEEYDTLEDALNECQITTDYQEVGNFGEVEDIGVYVDDEQLVEGCKFCYVHEAYPILSDIQMPVQEWEYWGKCIELKIISVLTIGFEKFGKYVRTTYMIRFNDKIFNVVWRNSIGQEDYYCTGFDLVEEKGGYEINMGR